MQYNGHSRLCMVCLPQNRREHMYIPSLLVKKREGQALTDQEIHVLIEGFCNGDVEDYQMSAFAMAVCLRGMNRRETTALTRAMLDSGDRLPRNQSKHERLRVDKHSTGGLGDKTSMVLAPTLAACGFDVPRISGRGLGISGGTLDKLESIPGFTIDLSPTESAAVLADTGVFIKSASDRIAPADRKLYALRDVTGTVESIPLITASILCKKLAEDLDALVMDVKVGAGGFMKELEAAHELADTLVGVGHDAGLPTSVLLTDMDQPLGQAVGNACEVNEAVEVLQGQRGIVRDLAIELGATLLLKLSVVDEVGLAKMKLEQMIDQGFAFERFERMLHAQKGKWQGPLPLAESHVITAESAGWIAGYDCQTLGRAVVSMGGGRRKRGDQLDHAVGLKVHRRIGDAVEKGDPLLTLYCDRHRVSEYVGELQTAVDVVKDPVAARPLVLHRQIADV
ncbi:MAG: thymidine phosphorylase [Rhodopirellula sp.]|nr:thymidine phosphorylase [Rhodopirellula sp.]